MRKSILLCIVLLITLIINVGYSQSEQPDLQAIDPYTLLGEKNLWTDFNPSNPDGTVNVVIEIPAGTIAKWEVTKPDGILRWEFKKGKPRVVNYLAYPGNYGMVPRTLLTEEMAGDGDPLDVILLGHAVSRGAVVKARIIGVLRLIDDKEKDDKIIAVPLGTIFDKVNTLEDLNEEFPGITLILETWFTNYKGRGRMEFRGYGNVAEARNLLRAAIEAFGRIRE